VIIGSDIVYEDSSVKPLWNCVLRLLSLRAESQFILAFEDRFIGLRAKLLASANAAGLTCEDVAVASFCAGISDASPDRTQRGDGSTSNLDFGIQLSPGSGDWRKMSLLIFQRANAETCR